jgi:hypothetical protein
MFAFDLPSTVDAQYVDVHYQSQFQVVLHVEHLSWIPFPFEIVVISEQLRNCALLVCPPFQ